MADEISRLILPWYRTHKRHLSFRDTGDAYRVLVSEIMLQQTRAETVEGYFDRFVSRFPDAAALAAAPTEDVLKAWEGLGYYSRARNLQRAAQIICTEYDGRVPDSVEKLLSLPGIGPYSAAAVASIAYGVRVPAMDGNLYRIFSRLYGIRDCVDLDRVKKRLYSLALDAMPEEDCGDFNQAMMDLGAGICVPGTPDCAACPLSSLCRARRFGHPEDLPVKSKKRAPLEERLAVVILRCGERVCLFRRTEKMLNSLYVFLLVPLPPEADENAVRGTVDLYLRDRIRALPARSLGQARHVFTHRVWNMELLEAECFSERWLGGGEHLWADAQALRSLPLPTAMRSARELALHPCAPGGAMKSPSRSANSMAENTSGSTGGWDER